MTLLYILATIMVLIFWYGWLKLYVSRKWYLFKERRVVRRIIVMGICNGMSDEFIGELMKMEDRLDKEYKNLKL